MKVNSFIQNSVPSDTVTKWPITLWIANSSNHLTFANFLLLKQSEGLQTYMGSIRINFKEEGKTIKLHDSYSFSSKLLESEQPKLELCLTK